ncbi:PTS system sucrose-specific IIC component [Geomicrobium halophilum]|uniref:PTS system sucrose-specific IIC component n=1 Tax=Geomicrobium halophilum TaxID=549000 RepID=A0A841PP34_9BACL|nr:PTS transporter subunit EIIC [Geomicrobium halophilum]MBB6450530.1 PTS system sucrose-specific IIC component [Geomicrobium halophilum]
MKKEKAIVRDILPLLGGKDNITSLANCMTRLRLNVKNYEKVQLDELRNTENVLGVVEDETLQIVLGPGTAYKVATELSKTTGLSAGDAEDDHVAEDTKAKVQQRNKTPIKNFLKRIGNIFIPLIPALIASGLINGGASFAENAGVDPETTWLQILLVIGGGLFSFLSILVGWNTAREFGGTPALGAIAGILIINPELEQITLFGEQLVAGQGGIFAAILAAWVMAIFEKLVRKFVPGSLDVILTPFITVLVVGVATILVLQPIGGVISMVIQTGINGVLEIGGAFAGAVLAGTFLPLVMVGMHHGLTPIHLDFIENLGNTPLLPILAMAGGGQVGAAIAVYVKTKSQKLKNTVKGTLPVGFLGVGEPLLYGVTLPLGRPFITACLGSAVGGAFQAIMATGATGVGISGLSLIPLIDDGQYLSYFIGLVIAYAFGFIFTYLFGFKEEMVQNLEK